MVSKLGVVAASRVAGVSRATVNRYIKAGKLTATKDRGGKTSIDTAELVRVFGELRPMQPDVRPSKRRQQQPRDTSFDTTYLQREVARLEAEVERLRRELAEERNERRQLQSVVNRRALPGPGILDRVVALFRGE